LQIPYEIRKNYKYFWLIDPLDGTKEFINKNGDFTVNIALIEGDRAIAGFVYAPFQDELFWGIKGQGAFSETNGKISSLKAAVFDIKSEGLNVVASRSHLNEATLSRIKKLNNPNIVNRGSSLKFMMLAKSEAHYYPRMSETMEWDIAAAQIILEEAGGKVLDLDGKTMLYNKASMQVAGFIACGNGNTFLD
jgi:3'(2'), 5'-bisphosphate nucleotidase